jgi:acetoacetyl-CoA synthetase
MSPLPPGEVLWQPPTDVLETTRIGHYMQWLARERGLSFDDYESLWQWSVDQLEDFWQSIWDYFDIISHSPPTAVLGSSAMPGAEWFPGATLNYAEHVLRHEDPDQVVLIAHSQSRPPIHMTRAELREEVSRVRRGLLELGVTQGDRVAGYVANIPEAVIGLLASASIGAIWAACPPEFGIQSVLDRLEQIDPTVLLVVDGYRYGKKTVDRVDEIAEIQASLPNLRATVTIPYLDPDAGRVPGTISWEQLRAQEGPLEFTPVPFDHPLWILFSSGTTGLPKAIVHGHGGIVLEHLKMGALLQDLGPDDRYFFFSTTAWMVWNRVVSALLTGAGMAILDGEPTYPSMDALFGFVAETGVTNWGVSATYLMMCREAGLVPGNDHDLSRVHDIVAAGSPVPIEGYRYVNESVKPGVHFYSGSGGTDVCTGFVSGTPISPVTAGEIPARMLGVMAEAYDEDGKRLIDEPGELVIAKPMPSMPVFLWNDPDKERYRSTYFDKYPGIWRHGDRFIVSERGTCNVIGRSDATLNRGGVRLGTGEFYDVVEAMPEISDSLVVHLEDPIGGRGALILFVVLADGGSLDDDLLKRVARELRRQRSPRHVPDEVYAVSDIPRTLTGKKLEVPVKKIMLGAEATTVANSGSLSNPDALTEFVSVSESRLATPRPAATR